MAVGRVADCDLRGTLSSCVNQETSSVVQGGAVEQLRPSPGPQNKALTFSTSLFAALFVSMVSKLEVTSYQEADHDTRLYFSLTYRQMYQDPRKDYEY